MGNICRSPTAEGVFRKRAEAADMLHLLEIDSAGTHDYHIGKAPDTRSQRAAEKRGYDLSELRARQVTSDDFIQFDYILAMDDDNLSILQRLRPQAASTYPKLFLSFGGGHSEREVPDPYYGGADGFEYVLDLIEDASDGLLRHLKESKRSGSGDSQ